MIIKQQNSAFGLQKMVTRANKNANAWRNHLACVESFFCLFNLPQDLLITQPLDTCKFYIYFSYLRSLDISVCKYFWVKKEATCILLRKCNKIENKILRMKRAAIVKTKTTHIIKMKLMDVCEADRRKLCYYNNNISCIPPSVNNKYCSWIKI